MSINNEAASLLRDLSPSAHLWAPITTTTDHNKPKGLIERMKDEKRMEEMERREVETRAEMSRLEKKMECWEVEMRAEMGGLKKEIERREAETLAEMSRLVDKEMEKANIKNQSIQFRLELELHQLREKLYQSREKMYQAALVFIVLLMLFYVSGYNGSNGSNLMLK